jgi:hypothetical protein
MMIEAQVPLSHMLTPASKTPESKNPGSNTKASA